MKFGVDAPWYQDSIERVAFNFYAMDCERLNEIADAAIEYFGYNIDLQEMIDKYEIKSQEELDYILERIRDK